MKTRSKGNTTQKQDEDEVTKLAGMLRQIGGILATIHEMEESPDWKDYLQNMELEASKHHLQDILVMVSYEYAEVGGFGRLPE